MVRYIAQDDPDNETFVEQQPPTGYLVLVVNGRANQTIPITKQITLGRDRHNAVVISDQKVSRHHATIQPQTGGTVTVEDEQSSNGTYVNKLLIRQPTILQDHDHLRIGDTQFLFSLTDIPLNSPIEIEKSVAPASAGPPRESTDTYNHVDNPSASLMDDPKAIWTALGCIGLIIIVLIILLAFLLGVYLAGPV